MKEPKLRFPEFTDEWKSYKVSEVAEKTFGGGTPKTSNETFWIGDIPWIQSSDLVDGNLFDINPKKYISQEAINKSAAKLIPENSIAVVTRVGVGKLMFIPFPYATSQDFLSLSGLKTEPQFTSYSLYKKLQQDLCKVQGTSIKGITKDELLVKEIMMPSYEEQKKIGECLRLVDTLIQSAEKELEGYRELKQGMLQKMFPKKGETTPEIRFPEFSGDWKQRKLGDIALVSTGCPFDSKDFSDDGDFLVITNGNIQDTSPVVDNSLGNRISIDDNKIKSTYLLDIGDILVTMDGTVGRTAKVIINGQILAQRVGRLKALNNSSFLYQWLNTGAFSKEMSILSHGGTIKHISLDEIRSYEAMIPQNDKEQEKIGKYFDNLDNLITSQQQELDGYKELKKGLLQQMFC